MMQSFQPIASRAIHIVRGTTSLAPPRTSVLPATAALALPRHAAAYEAIEWPNSEPEAVPGLVLTPPGAVIASNASVGPADGFAGKIAKQSVTALEKAGGTAVLYNSPHNGKREVAVWAPAGFDPTKPYEVVVYQRGINGDTAQSLGQQHMAVVMNDLATKGRNALVILPKSPSSLSNWMSDPDDMAKLMPEALAKYKSLTGSNIQPPRSKWLVAHSGGGKSVSNMLAHDNRARFDHILLADSTYGDWAKNTLALLRADPDHKVGLAAVVTQHNAARAEAQLAAQGIRVDRMPATYPYREHDGAPAYMLYTYFAGLTPPNPAW